MSSTRADAEALLFEFTRSDALRKHGRGVEEAMRAYAGWHGITDEAEIEKWGVVGLLHDFAGPMVPHTILVEYIPVGKLLPNHPTLFWGVLAKVWVI